MDMKLSFWNKIKAYRLRNNVIVLMFLSAVFATSIIVYFQPALHGNELISEVALAFFTSLLATIFAMCAELYVQYKTHENDQFLEDIHIFGIANLNNDKESLLREFLADCDKTIWISGYRLIMTNHLKSDIAQAVKRGAVVTTLVCPPWCEGFQLVYGKNEKVMDNYFEVFHAISAARTDKSKDFPVLFTKKPLFSDTYKVDQRLVTGPYMHNKDDEYHRIMAKDFFSYNLVKKSKLYDLVESEYRVLCAESYLKLNWDRFDEAYRQYCESDWREEEKIKAFQDACDFYEGEVVLL